MRKRLLYRAFNARLAATACKNLCLMALFSVVSTAAWALSEVNGVYQISTAADLEEFAVLVNDGNVYANAVLMTDVDRGIDGTMIGTETNPYQGTFDGQGHAIKINMYPEELYTGLFRYTGSLAVIQNLKVEGTITTASKFAAGIVARNRGIIRGCYVDVTINSAVAGDATHGGVAAVANLGSLIEDCLVKIAIVGESTTNCGGIVGWAEERTNIENCLVISDGSTFNYADASNGHSSNIARAESNTQAVNLETYNADPYANRPGGACYNNYVTVDWGGTNPATTVVPFSDLADGRICYQLNNDQSRIAWVQKIGTDPFPVPAKFGNNDQVFASAPTDCDGKSEGELTFSNSGSDQAAKHTFDKYGICTTCGCFNFHAFEFDDDTRFDRKDRAILLGSKADFDLAEGWNRVFNGLNLNMKMTADVEYIAEPGQYIFYHSNNDNIGIRGNFNGDGHALTIGLSEPGPRAALFPIMHGNVENLILHGSIVTNGANTGSVAGRACMALVRNVYSDVDITSSIAGDNSSGGLFGWMGIASEKHVENCIYAGDFTLPGSDGGARCARVGGFAGWTATKTYFTNCALLGNIIGAGDQSLDNDTENSQNIARYPGNVVTENVYVVNPIHGVLVTDHDKYTHYENEAGIANGELAFLLNSKQSGLERFYQLIGTDPEPMPIAKAGALVYSSASSYRCDGTPLGGSGYTNNPSGEAVIPPHNFVDGYCTVCGKFDENFITPVNGWYEISNGTELAWWCVYATAHPDASAVLTDDIDMSNDMERFVPVQKFVGTFDGQGHTISNFILDTNSDYQGLFSTICNGAVIKNFIFDETCEIYGNAFCGIIGGSDGAGDVYIENVGNEGTVTTTNQNAAGIIGVDMNGATNLHIRNCWTTGAIYGGRESGAMCGYSNGNSEIVNCWSTAIIPQAAIYDCDSFSRGSAKVINCYEADIEGVDPNKQQHIRAMAADRKCNTLVLEDVANGALCYNLNEKKFKEPSWYQTIDEDDHPYPFDTHGVVIYAGKDNSTEEDVYFSIPNDDVGSVANFIKSNEEEAVDDVIATQSLIDTWNASLEALDDVETVAALADAIEAVYAAKAAVEENAKVYEAYIAKCEEVKAYLASNTTFAGSLRESLEYYLSDENIEGPSADNPLGTYEYIVDKHVATAEEIKAETERVDKWLADALAADYGPGSDVSKMFANYDFGQQNESWTNGFITSIAKTQDGEGNTFNGVEAWQKTGDMYQTIEGMKPGYYLVGINGAFRPSNNVYSYNYAAGIYANGIFNYFPTVVEDYVSVNDTIDGVNCNLHVETAYDFEVYGNDDADPDEYSATLLGYAVQGEMGMAIAAKADRYQAFTIAKVGQDGKLTVGIKNPGTQYGSDWTGWGAIKVIYCGESGNVVNDALASVLENMDERATTILEAYIPKGYDEAAAGPNFSNELKEALEAAQGKIAPTNNAEANAALVAEFSDIFQRIYEGKQAYIQLAKTANIFDQIEVANLTLVEKDEEGFYSDKTDDSGNTLMLFTEDETDVIWNAGEDMLYAYELGTYTTEEALTPPILSDPGVAALVPVQDEEGYYLIGSTKQFAVYRYIASEMDKYAKGKLTADVDMAGIAMLPIGHNKGENAVHIFAGVFDGQGHALTNVYIDDSRFTGMQEGDPATLFYELQNATVKNLKLTGEYHTMHQNMGGVTRYMSGASTIDNCEIALVLRSGINGDGTHGGVVGYCGSSSAVVKNCLVNNLMMSDEGVVTLHVGGVCGWGGQALQIKNTLILSQYENIGLVEAGDVNSNSVCRNQSNIENVYISSVFREQKGTLVSAEQLASGEVTWKLNGSSGDNPFWFQTLGVDQAPHLFGGDVVYYYAGQYTNEKPNIQLNAFAYNLEAKQKGSNVVVSFNLNAEAESAKIEFSNGYSVNVPATDLVAGAHSVSVAASNLGSDPTALNFKIAVTGKGSLEVTKMGQSYKVWGPYGMAINNNPASKNFGQVLLTESWIEKEYNNNGFVDYHTAKKIGALFAFDPDFQPIDAADGTPGFYGGLNIAAEKPLEIVNGYALDLMDLQFTEDGRLFVARSGATSNSSVWEINPDDLDEPWKPVFTGGELDEATGITYVGSDEQNRMATALAFEGKGDDLRMYVLGGQRSNGQLNTTDYNCAYYDLGTATEWTAAPSGYVAALDGVYTNTPYQAGIQADGQGGLWFIQRTTPSADTPSIKHFNKAGAEDYSNISSQYGGGRMAITPNGNYIAIPTASNTIQLYETNYVPNEAGKIFLTPKGKSIVVGENGIASLAFDFAGNLYVASGGTETFSRYTIPYDNKLVVTPGNGIVNGLEGDLNKDGKVDIADAVTVLNIMAQGQFVADADLNGDGKIDIADFVTVLNIMAAQ